MDGMHQYYPKNITKMMIRDNSMYFVFAALHQDRTKETNHPAIVTPKDTFVSISSLKLGCRLHDATGVGKI